MTDPSLARALLNPRSIALVGASADPAKTSARPQRYLQKHGYAGRLLPINPGRDEIFGLPSYASLGDAPGPIDHAFIMLNGDAAVSAVEDCARLGIPCATLLAGGFAEAGGDGQMRQDALLATARAGGVRLLGPNSIGLINIADRVTLSANAMLELPELTAGRLGVISQSGSLIGALLSHGAARGIGFSALVSVGNEADLGVGEIGEMLVDDANTDAILLFLETLRSREAVVAMARRADAADKPVIAYKLGRSEVGQALAQSHTGAIAGSDATFDAFVRQHGIARVQTFEALIEAAPLFIGRPPPAGRRVTVATTTGGGAAMVIDNLGALGIEVLPASEAVRTRLADAGVPHDGGRLVDLTLAGAKPEIVSGVIGDLMAMPDCDAVVMVVGSSAQFRPELAVAPLAQWAASPKPLAVYLAPNAAESLRQLVGEGIAAFRTPESCADGLAAFLNRHPATETATVDAIAVTAAKRRLDATAPDALDESAAMAVFAALGIPTAATERVADAEAAVDAAARIGYPVAVKVAAAGIAHKTEAGGVALNIGDAEALAAACRQILENAPAAAPDAGLTIQKMARGQAEVLLGYRNDPLVGPTVTLGAGGVLAEIYADAATRLAPVSRADARTMIEEVRGLAPIRGYRGLPPGDCNALADAIVALSALAQIDDIAEAEINPLIVNAAGDGVVAVDGLIVRRATA